MKILLAGSGFKNFLFKGTIFLATVVTADFVIGKSLKKIYFKQDHGLDYLTTYAIEKTTAPVIVLGSSRALNIFNPAIIEKKLALPCYNAGRYGEPVFYHYALLKSILKRYTPAIIILSFDARDFAKDQKDYDLISALLPYYESHPEMKEVIDLKGPCEKLKMVSQIYPFNSLVLPSINGNLKFGKDNTANISGFIPLIPVFKGPLQTMDFAQWAILDTVKINIYTAFIKSCISAKVQLYIVCPPYLINAIGVDNSIITGKNIAREYGIPFLDFSRNPFYTNQPELFYDFRHLNEKGTTKQIADSIKQYL